MSTAMSEVSLSLGRVEAVALLVGDVTEEISVLNGVKPNTDTKHLVECLFCIQHLLAPGA